MGAGKGEAVLLGVKGGSLAALLARNRVGLSLACEDRTQNIEHAPLCTYVHQCMYIHICRYIYICIY